MSAFDDAKQGHFAENCIIKPHTASSPTNTRVHICIRKQIIVNIIK